MPGIVCAVRGGPGSHATVDKAISLATQKGLTIYFLYVVNLDFLNRSTITRIHTVEEEMREMGEFILLTAQSKAEAAGAAAQGVVRDGVVSDEIVKLSADLHADYVILGRPRREGAENVFAHDQLARFVERIEKESGASVALTDPGSGQ